MSDLAMRIIISAQDGASGVIRGVVSAVSGGGSSGLLGAIAGVGIAAVGLGISLGAVSTEKAAEFQQAMLLNVSHAGLLKSKMEETGQAVLQMSTDVGRSPVEMAQALYPILSGFSSIQDQSAKTAISLATLKLSFQAVAGSEANGVDVAHSAIAAFNAFGMQTNNQATNLQRMQTLFDQMNETVKTGNMKWAEYSRTIGIFAANMAQTHIKFAEGNAALAVFTNTGERTQLAATHLSSLFQKMSFDTDSLATHAKKLHLSFNETAFKSMNLADKIRYLDEITGHDTGKVKAILGNKTLAATFTKLRDHMNDYKSALGAISHSHGSLAESFKTASSGATAAWGRVKASLDTLFITIGSQLLPVLTSLMDKVAPLIAQFANWLIQSGALKNGMSFLGGVIQNVIGFLSKVDWGGIGNAINTVVGAFQKMQAFMGGGIGSSQAFDRIGKAIQFISGLISKIDWGKVFATVWHVLQQIGSFLASTFIPVWQELVTDFNQVKAAIEPVMPQLKQLAMVIGGIIVVAVILAIAIIAGLIKVFAAVLIGIARFVTGAIQFLTGLWQFIQGVMNLIADIFTGKWGKIGADIDQIMHGILSMITGILNMISGIWTVTWGAIQGFAEGFAQAIIGIFQDLANMLVGHSIVPDMLNSIVNFFSQLPGRALNAVQGLLGQLGGFFNNLAAQATTWGGNIIRNLAAGIQGAIGAVTTAVGNVTSWIAAHLPHSPAKVGPLRYLDKQGAEIVNQVSLGMLKARPTLQSHLSTALQPGGIGASGVRGGGGGGTVVNHYNITVNAPALSRREAQNLAESIDKELGHRFRSQYSSASSGAL